MTLVPGTNIKVTFLTFSGTHPDIYDATPQGTVRLVSVNAGNANANGLCVGLKGVNGAFLSVLALTQKRTNLSAQLSCIPGNHDDYQDRHLKLLAKADAGGAPWESYANTDPCAFSFVNPARISQAPGYTEGVCFVDVFDPKLSPYANPLNCAMLYAAPPFDKNYLTKAAFLVAIEELAGNIVKTVSAYNALAAQQNLPPIEAIRNTLYSSGYYNNVINASHDEIARAIFLGYVGQLSLDPNSGILELQFPVGDAAKNQDHPLFAAVQQDLAQNQLQAYRIPPVVSGGSVPMEERIDDNDPAAAQVRRLDVEIKGDDPATLVTAKTTLNNAATTLQNMTMQFDALLAQGAPLPASIADAVVVAGGHVYDSTSAALNPRSEYGRFNAVADDGSANSPVRDAFRIGRAAVDNLLDMQEGMRNARTVGELKKFRDLAIADAAEAVKAARYADLNATPGTERNRVVDMNQMAAQADATAKSMTAFVEAQDKCTKVFKDLQGKVRVGRVVGAVAVGVAAGGGILGLLASLHVFGNGSEPPIAPKNQNLDQDGMADGKPVSVDVLATNKALDANFNSALVIAVHLVDPKGVINDTPGNGWTVNGTTVTYTPPTTPLPDTTVSISYELEYTDTTIPKSPATKLTITFVAIATELVATTTTVANLTTATFTLPARAVFTSTNTAWKFDQTTNTVTYTLPAGVTTATVQETYQLGKTLPMNTAALVVLLPVQPVTLATAASLTNPTPSTPLPDPGLATWTLFDASGAPVKATGPWSLQVVNNNTSITFTPNQATPPQPSSTLTVSFGVVRGTAKQTAMATITFTVATGPVSTTMNVPFLAINRTAPVNVTIPNATNVALANPTTAEGTWTVNGAVVTFQPNPTFQAKVNEGDQATNTYTATGYTGTITLTFPLNLQLDSADRVAPTTIDFAGRNPRIQKTLTDITFNNFYPGQAREVNKIWEYYLPPGLAWQADFDRGLYNMTFAGDPRTYTAKLTINFETAFKAYDFTERVPQSQLPGPLSFDISKYCYFPKPSQLAGITLATGNDSRFWSYNPANKTSVTLQTDDPPSQSTYSLTYTVSDDSTPPKTSTATITVQVTMMRLMPMAADFLLTKDVWSPARVEPAAGMHVLKNCQSFYGIDESSVTLTGPVDLNADYAAPAAYGVNDSNGHRKSLRIPNEGSWLVDDDSGKIGFVAETGLTTPPTPVGYQFRDKKGNLSNQGVMIIHSALNDAMTGIPNKLKALTDAAFWASFQQHVIWWKPAIDVDQFVATATLFAGMTHAVGMVGVCPVSDLEFDAAFNVWFKAGHHWHEPSGQEDANALFALCRDLVNNKTKGTSLPFRARYWRLTLMARMLCYPTPNQPTS